MHHPMFEVFFLCHIFSLLIKLVFIHPFRFVICFVFKCHFSLFIYGCFTCQCLARRLHRNRKGVWSAGEAPFTENREGSMKRWVETEANTYIYGWYILFLVHIIYTSTPLLKSCSSTSQKPARGVWSAGDEPYTETEREYEELAKRPSQKPARGVWSSG